MATLLEDLLSADLSNEDPKIIVSRVFDHVRGERLYTDRSKTLGPSRSLNEFYELVRQLVNYHEDRFGTKPENKVTFTEEEPDATSRSESITFSLIRQEPGQFSQGPPFGGKHQNLRPILREQAPDTENPGYRLAVTGYWYDNLVRFTCWATTNKRANQRAEWFQNMMEDHAWWLTLSGVARVIFQQRDADIVTMVDGNKWYGRPLDYFVKTEKIRVFKEKTLQEILVTLKVATQ